MSGGDQGANGGGGRVCGRYRCRGSGGRRVGHGRPWRGGPNAGGPRRVVNGPAGLPNGHVHKLPLAAAVHEPLCHAHRRRLEVRGDHGGPVAACLVAVQVPGGGHVRGILVDDPPGVEGAPVVVAVAGRVEVHEEAGYRPVPRRATSRPAPIPKSVVDETSLRARAADGQGRGRAGDHRAAWRHPLGGRRRHGGRGGCRGRPGGCHGCRRRPGGRGGCRRHRGGRGGCRRRPGGRGRRWRHGGRRRRGGGWCFRRWCGEFGGCGSQCCGIRSCGAASIAQCQPYPSPAVAVQEPRVLAVGRQAAGRGQPGPVVAVVVRVEVRLHRGVWGVVVDDPPGAAPGMAGAGGVVVHVHADLGPVPGHAQLR
mmetsp:Transcript_53401/g.152176  ORF Transcript_53401/g.152176 Transcript_53401/m.152176 type:complete len:366 (-) Transcript_53401:1049-2146(-)